MSLKQDRTGTRTSEDLRRRLNVKGVDDAVKKIEINEQTVQDLSVNVFNLNKSLSNTRQTYVSTDNQTFTEEQKTRARNNIGAGISSFSGSYNDLSNKPNIPTKTSDLTNDRGFISDSNYVHTDNNFTDNEKTKLSGIEIGAEKNKITSVNSQTGDVVIDIPTKLSDLTNDLGFITETVETDPTVPTYVKSITLQDIANWNKKSSFSGSYNDLSNKPNIPTKTSDLTNDRGFISDSNYVHTDNNFTDNEKTKLSGIEIGAEVNLIESISIDGVAQPISNKNANLSIPSQTVDASISDSSTNAVQNKVVKQYIDNVIETKEDTSNKITSWGTNEEAITDTQYPSAKLIFNTLENVVVSYAETSDIISLFSTGD